MGTGGPSYRETKGGLLGLPAPPDGGKESLRFASGCGPVRFDLDYSLFSGHESEAADRSVRSTPTNPPDAPPIHALLGCGECSAASPRACAHPKRGGGGIPPFKRRRVGTRLRTEPRPPLTP